MGFYIRGDGRGGNGHKGQEDKLAGLVERCLFAGGEKVAEDKDQKTGDGSRRDHLDQAPDRVAGLFFGDTVGQGIERVDVILGDLGVLVDNNIVFGEDPLDASDAASGLASKAGCLCLVDREIGYGEEIQ